MPANVTPSRRSTASTDRRPSIVKRVLRLAPWVLLAAWAATVVWHTVKPLPPGVHYAGPPVPVADDQIEFLHDLTYRDERGEEVVEQEIFDRVLAIIERAESFVLVDFFLVNDHAGSEGRILRPLSHELARALVLRKHERPDLPIVVITDPINDVYGGDPSPILRELREAGIEVVVSDLTRLRDSNPAYSALWRMLVRWLGNSSRGGWLPHPFRDDGSVLTLRTYLELINFKANHRKVVVADDGGDGLTAIVTSANPHDASSAHSNVALEAAGAVALQVLESETAIARFSGWRGELPSAAAAAPDARGASTVRFLTEGAILSRLLSDLAEAREGDEVEIAMFYLSERRFVEALLAAAERGVRIRLILDPNRDAFGRRKDGVPNRPVANELVTRSGGTIAVRWYETHGEQFHSKMTVLRRSSGRTTASLGSANLTRRNVGDLNLEANFELETLRGSPLDVEIATYFETLWSNRGGHLYTVDFERYRDRSKLRYWRYRLMEATGMSTF